MPGRNGPHAPSQSSFVPPPPLLLLLHHHSPFPLRPTLSLVLRHGGGLSISRPLRSINLSSSNQRGGIRKSLSVLHVPSPRRSSMTSALSSRISTLLIAGRSGITFPGEISCKKHATLCIRHKGGRETVSVSSSWGGEGTNLPRSETTDRGWKPPDPILGIGEKSIFLPGFEQLSNQLLLIHSALRTPSSSSSYFVHWRRFIPRCFPNFIPMQSGFRTTDVMAGEWVCPSCKYLLVLHGIEWNVQ